MQRYYKLESNGKSLSPNPNNQDLILSRNRINSLSKRLKSNSMNQTKLLSIQKSLNQGQIINDFEYPKTSRESMKKSNSNSILGKHQSLHIQQSLQQQMFSDYFQLGNGQLNTKQSNNDLKLISQYNQSKTAYIQAHGLQSPSTSMNQYLNLSFTATNSEEIQQMKQLLQNLISKEENILRSIEQSSNKLNEIISLFGSYENFHLNNENDFIKFSDAIQNLSSSLTNAAKNEIELGAKCREIERLTIEYKNTLRKNINLKEKCQEQQKINDLLSQRNKQILEENNKYQILLNTEKKDNRINTKKVSALEKRVEFILENEINVTLNPNDKLRQSLNELLRENESLKRDLAHKNQEIERNLGNIKRMNDIINRLSSKIEKMRKNPSKYFDNSTVTPSNLLKQDNKSNKENGEQAYMPQNAKIIKNDDIDLFSNFVIPQNLEFRITSMKPDHQNTILDLVEAGALNFTKQIMQTNNQIQQREVKLLNLHPFQQFISNIFQQVLNLLANQFLSFKDISEKVNSLLKELQILFSNDDLKDIIPYLNISLQKIFHAEIAHIWFVECQQGIFVTYENGKEKKCLISKGLLSESFFAKKPINSKNARNKALYHLISEDKEQQVMVDTCLIIPIFDLNSNQVKVFLNHQILYLFINYNYPLFHTLHLFFSFFIILNLITCLLCKRDLILMQEKVNKQRQNEIKCYNNYYYLFQQVKMIIETSNSKNELFSFDEEYLSIIIGQYLNNITTLKQVAKKQDTLIKFNQQFFESFDSLMYSQNKFELAQRIQKAIFICFGITNFTFFYVEDNCLVKYENSKQKQTFSLKHGLVGQAVIDQKQYIISDVKYSSYYNKLVDLQSILPVYAIPLLDKEAIKQSTEENPISECYGVIEIALKQKFRSSIGDQLIDATEGYFGMEESLQTKVLYFCQMIVHAIKLVSYGQVKSQ